MTGPEHYREAERLLAQADRWESNVTDDTDSYAAIDGSRQAAQVHATLALVALPARSPGSDETLRAAIEALIAGRAYGNVSVAALLDTLEASPAPTAQATS